MVRKNAQQNNLLINSQQSKKLSQKQLEELESMKAIQNQVNHYNQLDMKRQDFLVKINTLNQKIESLDKKGVYSMNYTL